MAAVTLRSSTAPLGRRLAPAPLSDLPDLSGRIDAMGLQEEYQEFSARYFAWRRGKAAGAQGELGSGTKNTASSRTDSDSTLRAQASPMGNHDFGFWYPSLGEWRWRRTISFWIGLTFFEGSVFFAVSSFLGCTSSERSRSMALTTGGYIWGKVHYLICTYLMVVSTVNMDPEGDLQKSDTHGDQLFDDSDSPSSEDEVVAALPGEIATPRFMTNPFRYRTALDKLNALGAGPWPYIASMAYFTGCLTFVIALAADFAKYTPFPDEIAEQIAKYAFLLGSVQFLLGGLAECIENDVFTSCQLSSAWAGAGMNLLGGMFFLLGSVVPFVPAWTSRLGGLVGGSPEFWGSLWFGVGSTIYAAAGSVQLMQWRCEQFGLVYMSVLNKLGEHHGTPLEHTPSSKSEPAPLSFSTRSLVMIHIFCIAGAISCYDFNLKLAEVISDPRGLRLSGFQEAFSELMPCIILHMQIALRTVVCKAPQFAPYHQLFVAMRVLSVLLVVDSVASFARLWLL